MLRVRLSFGCCGTRTHLPGVSTKKSYVRLTRFLLTGVALLLMRESLAAQTPDPCPNAQPVPAALRIPATLPPGEAVGFEKQVLGYLSTLAYRKLGWCEDKWVRDTGPYMKGTDAIVHPPVRIFYSPEVSKWLLGDRQGEIPDGAVIIKEQFGPPPAARYANIPADKLGCS